MTITIIILFAMARIILFVFSALGVGTLSLPQCPPPDGQFYSPSIPDSYFNASYSTGDVVETALGLINIFTIPSVPSQCNGTVTALEFCYRAHRGYLNTSELHDVFEFLSVTRDGHLFNIIYRFTVQSALQSSYCSHWLNGDSDCCDTFVLPQEQWFKIPSTFGVNIPNSDRNLLAIPFLAVDLNIEQFRTVVIEGRATGDQINLPDIPLLRFVTRKLFTTRICAGDA